MQKEIGGAFFVSYYKIDDIEKTDVLRDVYLTFYRLTTSQSPTGNFGRMFSGYSKSSSSERDIRGQKVEESPNDHPIGTRSLTIQNITDVFSDNWIGFDWSNGEQHSPDNLGGLSHSYPSKSGVFRVWKSEGDVLEAVGTARDLNEEIATVIPDDKNNWKVSYSCKGFQSRAETSEVESILSGAHYIATKAVTNVVENREYQIKNIIENGESEETELKQEMPEQADVVVKELLSIANSGGGQLILGARDNSEIVGLDNIKKVKERVSNLIEGNTKTRLPINYENVSINANDLLVVSINGAEDHPFAFKDGKFYRRNGPQRTKMSGNELQEWFSE
jgi:hypothetical protein